jgi:hypothetical protein
MHRLATDLTAVQDVDRTENSLRTQNRKEMESSDRSSTPCSEKFTY